MKIEHYFQARQNRINSFLTNILPPTHQNPTHLHEAMHYAVLNGGKRIRPLLVYATGEAFGVELNSLDHPAAAIELIHAYSLVHDDLPSMDNDDLRRGKATCHIAYDEATAILVGDSLQSLAYQILTVPTQYFAAGSLLEMTKHLASASGSLGMAGGQALDLRATAQCLDVNEVKSIHALKTGALITTCVKLGLVAADISDVDTITAFTTFAADIGLCFQIQDDILDAEGTLNNLGKNVGADATKKKATFTTLQGLDQAKKSLQYYYEKAMASLSPYGEKASYLRGIADYIIKRNH